MARMRSPTSTTPAPTPTYQEVQNARVIQGRFYTDFEDLHREDVAVIGYDIDKNFFPAHDGIGKTILVDGVPYKVIGVLANARDSCSKIRAPTAPSGCRTTAIASTTPPTTNTSSAPRPIPVSKMRPKTRFADCCDAAVMCHSTSPIALVSPAPAALAEQFRQIMSTVALMTFIVSCVGLLVGGVGVMNIMLMSVTERTHEIGVRKAIGARRSDVIRQFLTEAVVLTGLGGLAGVLVGVGAAAALPLAFPSMPTSVPMWAVIVAVMMAMSVGLFFGMYPAVKASRLDPVEALRYE